MSTMPFHLAREDRRYYWARENNRFLRFLVKDSQEFRRNQMELYSGRYDQANALTESLTEVKQQLAANQREDMEVFSRGLDNIAANQNENTEAVITLTWVVARGIELQAKQFEEHQRQARIVIDTLRKRYGTDVRELRDDADKFLEQARGLNKHDKKLVLKEALRVLREITKNPIGQGDYVVWYKIGCLVSVLENDFVQAEMAFERARFLSIADKNIWHVDALHDLAEIQHLQGKHAEAYSTIQKALDIERDYSLLFDAARYAARADRPNECITLLEQCVNIQPSTIERMRSVGDFQTNPNTFSLIEQFANRLVSTLRTEVRKRLTQWSLLLDLVKHVESKANINIALPGQAASGLTRMEAETERAGYLILLVMRSDIQSAIERTEEAAKRSLASHIEELQASVSKARNEFSGVTISLGSRLRQLREVKESAERDTLRAAEVILPPRPDIRFNMEIFFARRLPFGYVGIGFAVLAMVVAASYGYVKNDEVGLVILLAFIFGTLISWGISIAIALSKWRSSCSAARQRADVEVARAKVLLSAITTNYPNTLREFDRIRETTILPMERRLTELVARKERMEANLTFFQRGTVLAACGQPVEPFAEAK